MTTLAANINRKFELESYNSLPVIASDIIFKGAAVGYNGSGYVRPLVAGDIFAGFAQAKADNSTGSAGDIDASVQPEGFVELPISGLAITDEKVAIYASDDNTFTKTATGNSYIGTVHRFVSSGVGVVKFKAGKTVAQLTGSLTGTVNGALADVSDIALSTSNTYTDAAVNTAVNAAIAEVNVQLKELQTKVNELITKN